MSENKHVGYVGVSGTQKPASRDRSVNPLEEADARKIRKGWFVWWWLVISIGLFLLGSSYFVLIATGWWPQLTSTVLAFFGIVFACFMNIPSRLEVAVQTSWVSLCTAEAMPQWASINDWFFWFCYIPLAETCQRGGGGRAAQKIREFVSMDGQFVEKKQLAAN